MSLNMNNKGGWKHRINRCSDKNQNLVAQDYLPTNCCIPMSKKFPRPYKVHLKANLDPCIRP